MIFACRNVARLGARERRGMGSMDKCAASPAKSPLQRTTRHAALEGQNGARILGPANVQWPLSRLNISMHSAHVRRVNPQVSPRLGGRSELLCLLLRLLRSLYIQPTS